MPIFCTILLLLAGSVFAVEGTSQIMNIENATISYPSECSYSLGANSNLAGAKELIEFECGNHSFQTISIRVYSQDSISDFEDECSHMDCMFIKWPTVDNYYRQQEDLIAQSSDEGHEFFSTPHQDYVVGKYANPSGGTYIKEYTTYIDNVRYTFAISWNALGESQETLQEMENQSDDLISNSLFITRAFSVSIQYLLDHGIASGYPDGTFRPNDPINRAEFTKIIVGAVGLGTEGLCKMASFSDVMGTEWYGPFSQAARCAGIIGGYPDGTFRAAQNMNTAEAAKIVAKAFELTTEEPGTDPWFQPYMQAIRGIDALPPSAQDPAHLLTRGEVAEIIYRVMTRTE